jgi:hypothetical protein
LFLLFLKIYLIFIKERLKERLQKEAEPPWSLHIGSFRKIHFINPPEVRGQVVRLKGKDGITMVIK